MLAALASACRDQPPRDDDTLVALAWGGDRLLMPWVNMPTMHLMFEPLFGYDREGNTEGRLIRAWEHSPDGRVWTYHLRTDVRWHDGVPFTTRDIEFTRRFRAENPRRRLADSLVVIDDFTFQRIFHEAGQPLDDWGVFLPKHVVEDLDPSESWEWPFNFQPVGNGPYRYVRHVSQTMIELEANPDYYRGKPPIKRIVLRLGGGVPMIELGSGNVDMALFGTVGVEDIPSLTAHADLRYYWRTANGVLGVSWNLRDPVLADVRVRRALAYAVDRAELAAVMDYPDDIVFRDVPVTWNQRLRGEAPMPLPFDRARSRRLLQEAGWRDTDGDGVRDREGRPLSIEVQTRGGVDLLVALQAQLARVGVRLEIVTNAAVGDLLTALRRDQVDDVGDVQALFHSLGRCPEALPGFRVGASDPGGRSHFGYRNEELFAIAEATRTAIIPEDMDELCRRTWPILQQDQPSLFLLPDLWLSAAHRKVKGLQNGTRVWASSNIVDLWIEEDRR